VYPGRVRPVPSFQVMASFHGRDAAENGPPDLQMFAGGPWQDGDAGMFLIGGALLKPRSRGSVRLRSADPSAPPRIDLGYFHDPADLDRLTDALTLARQVAAAPAVKALSDGVEPSPISELPHRDAAGLRSWVRREAWTYHHPVGTCAMGPDPTAGAVVDASGAVHGIEGLSVADASIMPDIPSANTHLPTVMVAERIASLSVQA
jgi:choline dehydrogenase